MCLNIIQNATLEKNQNEDLILFLACFEKIVELNYEILYFLFCCVFSLCFIKLVTFKSWHFRIRIFSQLKNRIINEVIDIHNFFRCPYTQLFYIKFFFIKQLQLLFSNINKNVEI